MIGYAVQVAFAALLVFLIKSYYYSTIDLLIDISDVLQICCYELGRTYLKLSQALCINLPSIGEYTYPTVPFDPFIIKCECQANYWIIFGHNQLKTFLYIRYKEEIKHDKRDTMG